MILKTCTFILQSRGYGKTYYENLRKENEEKKNKHIKTKVIRNEKDNTRC